MEFLKNLQDFLKVYEEGNVNEKSFVLKISF